MGTWAAPRSTGSVAQQAGPVHGGGSDGGPRQGRSEWQDPVTIAISASMSLVRRTGLESTAVRDRLSTGAWPCVRPEVHLVVRGLCPMSRNPL